MRAILNLTTTMYLAAVLLPLVLALPAVKDPREQGGLFATGAEDTQNPTIWIRQPTSEYTQPSCEKKRSFGAVERSISEVENEISNLSYCLPHGSCEGHCGEHDPSNSYYQSYFNCRCDADCEIFQDCCPDYSSACARHHADEGSGTTDPPATDRQDGTAEDSPPLENFDCVKISGYYQDTHWVVTRCSPSWTDADIQRQCEDTDNMDFLSVFPVTGEDGFTYRNAFCAQCNHMKNFTFWNVHAGCWERPPDSRDPAILPTYLNHSCLVRIRPERTERPLRFCEPDLVTSCPPDSTPTIAEICRSYESIVLGGDSKAPLTAYKNRHCAMCNGVDNNDLFCPTWRRINGFYWTLGVDQTSSNVQNNRRLSLGDAGASMDFSGPLGWLPAAFSVLMDFDPVRGESSFTYTDLTNPAADEDVEMVSCEAGQIYDPFLAICRSVFCGDGFSYDFWDKMCVSNQNSSAVLQTIHITLTIQIQTYSSLVDEELEHQVIGAVTGLFNISQAGLESINVNIDSPWQQVNTNASSGGRSPQDSNVQNGPVGESYFSMTFSLEIPITDNIMNGNYSYFLDNLYANLEDFDFYIAGVPVNAIDSTEDVDVDSFQCRNGTIGRVYDYMDFIFMTDQDNNTILHVNSTCKSFSEEEFTVYSVSMHASKFGELTTQIAQVLVCVDETSCPIVPLNQSEYQLFPNNSLLYLACGYGDYLMPPGEYCIINGQPHVVFCENSTTDDSGIDYEPVEALNAITADRVVTFVAMVVSLTTLAVTIVTYLLFSSLRTLPGLTILNLSTSLFLSQVVFLSSVNRENISSDLLCKVTGMGIHYLYLTSFFWMNVTAFMVYKTFVVEKTIIVRCRSDHMRKALRYMAYAWGCPLIIVSICAVLEFVETGPLKDIEFGYGGKVTCWISKLYPLIFAFFVPLAIIIVANAILFIITVISITRTRSVQGKNARQNVKVYVRLSTVMGFTWIFGFLAVVVNTRILTEILWFLFIIFNCLQGVFLFVAFVCNTRVLNLYKKRLGLKRKGGKFVRGMSTPPCSPIKKSPTVTTLVPSSPTATVDTISEACMKKSSSQAFLIPPCSAEFENPTPLYPPPMENEEDSVTRL
ncbi:ADGRL2 [Branchiostoma lanceolatum]|uniref:ADGRL2 protein n=1 Tax=Branchiostoma lanceolatum TaxID=7740 RepID=A0A8J9VLT2_BRALA|nr:ADGRL2 [Branchiostoma lanceolatum]